jgi:hypothetical protein
MTTRSAELTPVSGASWPWLESAVQMAWRSCRNWPSEHADQDDSWTAMPRVATRTPVPATHSIATARAFTVATMDRWGAVDRGEDVAAVVSELLTNALRHALPQASRATGTLPSCPIRLGLLHPGPYVVCAVADPSIEMPVPRQPDWQDETGRGLLVVSSLSDQWGYCAAPTERGKVVWAAFATTARPQ